MTTSPALSPRSLQRVPTRSPQSGGDSNLVSPREPSVITDWFGATAALTSNKDAEKPSPSTLITESICELIQFHLSLCKGTGLHDNEFINILLKNILKPLLEIVKTKQIMQLNQWYWGAFMAGSQITKIFSDLIISSKPHELSEAEKMLFKIDDKFLAIINQLNENYLLLPRIIDTLVISTQKIFSPEQHTEFLFMLDERSKL
jgi:hypothetical protein